ncbi:MAG: hypothetical protein N4A33_11135 [Bacteriovoracaceae bacterium]|jgi:hypothetical protein|nr:hypothetical protein [Bacteriovoracaceae bacterium]
MEKLAYYFNCDLEDFLSSGKSSYDFVSNKFNQEFEYLMVLIDEIPLYTQKVYSKEYTYYLKKYFNISFEFSYDFKNAKGWCFELYDLETQKKINSRFFTTQISNKFNDYKSYIIDSIDQLENGFLYKEEFSVSGIGNYTYKDKEKLYHILKKRPVLKEKLHKRLFDISTLVISENKIHYENFIDKNFGYKGSRFRDLSKCEWYQDYCFGIDSIVLELKRKVNIKGVYSIDSFFVEDGIHFMSEVNNRKTMGYIAFHLKEKFFPTKSFFDFILIPTKKIKNFTYDILIEDCYLVSPRENLFSIFIYGADSLNRLNDINGYLYKRYCID